MKIEDYKQQIDRMVRAMNGETVLNGSAEHAAVINERMFNHAAQSMDIVTRNLDPRVYGTDELVASAKLFLGMPERKLRIAVENAPAYATSGHPLTVALSEFENFEIREIPTEFHNVIDVNFTVMDKGSYRFESDKRQAVAVACFGDTTGFASKLDEFFERVWHVSSEIEHKTPAGAIA